MLKQLQQLKISQNLSPQQIMLMKLLQVPTMDLKLRIEDELIENPALELVSDEDIDDNDQMDMSYEDLLNNSREEDKHIDSLDEALEASDFRSEDESYYNNNSDDDDYTPVNSRLRVESSFHEFIENQLTLLNLSENELIAGMQIIGSLDDDGYLRRDLKSISNDIFFSTGVSFDESFLKRILAKIQQLEPYGIGASDLRECLLLQIYKLQENNPQAYDNAKKILEKYFEAFVKKQYDKLQTKLNISNEELKEAIQIITSLNPKPGSTFIQNDQKLLYIIPDFFVRYNGVDFDITLNSKNAPSLKISKDFKMLAQSFAEGSKLNKEQSDALVFAKHKIDSAQWFIDSIKQRQNTLLQTMYTIVELQPQYFKTGDKSDLKPMILKDVAEKIELDVSTISRVVNQKYVDTEFGIFKLKDFFSEGMTNAEGEEVSNLKIKTLLEEIIDKESKAKPLSDLELQQILKEKGFDLARRTVSKYREQLNIPVSRLRKEL